MGSGKTYQAIKFVSKHPELKFLYFAPTHKVCDEIERDMRARKISVIHLKGREFLENGVPYCLRLDEVREIQERYFGSAEMICADCEFNCLRKKSGTFCKYKKQFKDSQEASCILTVPAYLQTRIFDFRFDEFDYLIVDDGYSTQKEIGYTFDDFEKLADFLLMLNSTHQLEEFDQFEKFGRYNLVQVLALWLKEISNRDNWKIPAEKIDRALAKATDKEDFKDIVLNHLEELKASDIGSPKFSKQAGIVASIIWITEKAGIPFDDLVAVLKREIDDYLLPGEAFTKEKKRHKKKVHRLLEQYFEFQWRHHYRLIRDGKEQIELPKLILDRAIELLFQVVHSWNAPKVFTNIQFSFAGDRKIKDVFERCNIPAHRKAIILDGTPDFTFYQRHFPNLKLWRVPIDASNSAIVTQFINGKFGKKQLNDNASRSKLYTLIKELIKRECRELLEEGAKFLITGSLSFLKEEEKKAKGAAPKSIQSFLFRDPVLAAHRDQFAFVHFNSSRSSNEFKDYHVLIHFGEINPSWEDTENYIRTFYPYQEELVKINREDSQLKNRKFIEEEEIPVQYAPKVRNFKSLFLGPNFKGDWGVLKGEEVIQDVEYLDQRVQGFVEKIRNSELAQLIYRIRPSEMTTLNGRPFKKRIFIFNSREIPGIEPHVVQKREKVEVKQKLDRVIEAFKKFSGGATIDLLAEEIEINQRTVRRLIKKLETCQLISRVEDESILQQHKKLKGWKGNRGRKPEILIMRKEKGLREWVSLFAEFDNFAYFVYRDSDFYEREIVGDIRELAGRFLLNCYLYWISIGELEANNELLKKIMELIPHRKKDEIDLLAAYSLANKLDPSVFAVFFDSSVKHKIPKKELLFDFDFKESFYTYLDRILKAELVPNHLKNTLESLLVGEISDRSKIAELLDWLAGVNLLVLNKVKT